MANVKKLLRGSTVLLPVLQTRFVKTHLPVPELHGYARTEWAYYAPVRLQTRQKLESNNILFTQIQKK
jgi:hypothetical protein